jgi:hypothetical protein
MTITADWQAELAGVTVGAGTPYEFSGPMTGLGLPAPRTADLERGLSPGDVGGQDVDARRVLTVQVSIDAPDETAASVWALFDQLKAAWATTPVDVPFDLRLPGFDAANRRWYGRPRGVDADVTLLRLGHIDALCTFEALDPYGYGDPVEVALVDGETPLVNPGTAPSDRWTLTADVTASPTTFSAGGTEPPLTVEWSGDGEVLIDGRARTIVDALGADLYPALTPGSGWPILTPGSTPVTLTGATGTLVYRPAYR